MDGRDFRSWGSAGAFRKAARETGARAAGAEITLSAQALPGGALRVHLVSRLQGRPAGTPAAYLALYENGHPPNHTAGGINMNFLPMGPLLRRSGVFFIRRTFKDNPIYKFVLGQYIDYLVEKRFPLEWYIEGGRSRSGKLLPPRFGLLAYVVDAYQRAKSEDVWLIPVSIGYDQIQDVSSYVTEQRGGQKERESLSWFLRVFRMLKRRYGEIYISFG